jgi:hypothetical protein
MSRSGYSDDCDGWALIRWRGAVASAIRGKRGQQALAEILAALDALPEKRLAADSLVSADGEFCTLGALGRQRGLDMNNIDPDDRETVAAAFGISEALAAEIMFLNDEVTNQYTWVSVEICGPMRNYSPEFGKHVRSVCVKNDSAGEVRWWQMREWVASNIEAKPIGASS